MEQLNRGDKIYLDSLNQKESAINTYLECRDGIVEVYEYREECGYGPKTRLFICQNTKHESVAIIRQTYNGHLKEWNEQVMYFYSDDFEFLKGLIIGNEKVSGGSYTLVRDY